MAIKMSGFECYQLRKHMNKVTIAVTVYRIKMIQAQAFASSVLLFQFPNQSLMQTKMSMHFL